VSLNQLITSIITVCVVNNSNIFMLNNLFINYQSGACLKLSDNLLPELEGLNFTHKQLLIQVTRSLQYSFITNDM
jgi:hypothetical protein